MFTARKGNYGYGWFIHDHANRKCVEHGGGIAGFVTSIARYPEDRVVVIVLCNFDTAQPEKISRELAAMLFRDNGQMKTGRRLSPTASPRCPRRCRLGSSTRARPLVLLVDDEEMVRSCFRAMLETEPGTRVVEAGPSERALELARRRKFDLVIPDIGRSGMDGLEFLRVFRKEHRRIPVMSVSGSVSKATWQRAHRPGACCGLARQIDAKTVLNAVTEALRRCEGRA